MDQYKETSSEKLKRMEKLLINFPEIEQCFADYPLDVRHDKLVEYALGISHRLSSIACCINNKTIRNELEETSYRLRAVTLNLR